MRSKLLAAAAAFGFAVSVMGMAAPAWAQEDDHETTHWEYVGKYGSASWGKLDPAYKTCSSGKEQSPIDIHGAKRNKALKPIEFHYISGPVTVWNNGHSIEVQVGKGSYIVSDGVRYDLVQYHFHHPGEEAIKGKLSDMAVHLVHKSADGKYAVISVLLNEDINTPNPLLATLWANLPKTAGQTEKISEYTNAGGLLPADRNYWTYAGSFSAPPCTEGVKWFVLQQPMMIGRGQLRTFAGMFPINSRPLQDAHGRKVEASQ